MLSAAQAAKTRCSDRSPSGSASSDAVNRLVAGRVDAVEDQRGDAVGIAPHRLQRQPGAVGRPEQHPSVEAEGQAQIGHVAGAVGRGVAGQVVALGLPAAAAGAGGVDRGRGVAAVALRAVAADLGVDHLRAGQVRLRLAHAALVVQHQLALLQPVVAGDQVPPAGDAVGVQPGRPARAAFEIQHRRRVAELVGGGQDGDRERHRGAVGLVPVLRHGDGAAGGGPAVGHHEAAGPGVEFRGSQGRGAPGQDQGCDQDQATGHHRHSRGNSRPN